jgi:hypothetical protein
MLTAESYFHIGNDKIFFVGRILGILGTLAHFRHFLLFPDRKRHLRPEPADGGYHWDEG